jgi:hypothetical protein
MTVNEMLESFLVYYDRITSFSAPGYEAVEKLLFLNNAQNDFIKDRMFGQNFQPPAFEDNQRRVADLRTLVTSLNLIYVSQDSHGARQYTIPVDFMFAIKAYAICSRSAYPVILSSEEFECRFIKSEEVGKFLSTTYNKTHFLKPVISISGLYAKVIVDRFTTNSTLSLQYIKKPMILAENGICDMPVHTHQEIVDMAVRQALQAIQDPRWQSSVTEEKIKSN